MDRSEAGQALSAAAEAYATAETSVSEFFTVACPGMGCHQNCPLRAEVVDGRIVKVDPAPVPGSPENTHACLRGIASVDLPYMEQRLKYPMKRVGERGEGKWARISWDEAYATIAKKMLEIRDKHGAQAVRMHGSGSSSVPLGGVNGGAATGRLSNLFGCTEVIGWAVDGGPFCAGLVNYGFFFGGGNDPADWVNSKLLIIWGENMAESSMRDFNHVMRAQAQGTKVVVIGPLFDATAAKADWWIPIEPATDGALALSMLHVIFEQGLHNPDFIGKYTVGPLLVRDDNGQFLKESDIDPAGSSVNYLVWDKTKGRAVAMPPKTNQIDGVTPSIEGSFNVAGIACKPAFQLLVDRAAEYEPNRAAEICKIEPQVIRDLAIAYASSKPAAIKLGFGISRTLHGDLNARAALALAAVTGNVGLSGGGASGWARAYAPMINNGPIYAATDKRSRRVHISKGQLPATDGDDPIKAMLLFASNPLNTMPNANIWIKELLPKLDFLLVVDIVESWSAQYADILLPGTTIYERSDIYTGLGCTILSQQAIEPQYEAKSDVEICTELAKRLGLGEHFTKSTDEYLEMLLDHPTQEGITLQKLKDNNGIVRAKGPTKPMVAYVDRQFPTPSGRIEFYADYLKGVGQEMPSHLEPGDSKQGPLGKKYPLQFFTGRRKFTNQSQSYSATTKELCPEPRLRMNPVDAQARGVKEEDAVQVRNDRGHVKVKVQLSEGVRPGTTWLEHGWWPKDFEEGHYQSLLRPSNKPEGDIINPAFQIFWEMYKEFARTAPSPGLAPYGLADQIFDCLVEVTKA